MAADPHHVPPPPLVHRNGSGLGAGFPARVARDGDGLTYAVIPSPTYATPTNTLAQRKNAIQASYGGSWDQAVALYRQTVEEDGFFCGILDTLAHGILGLPQSFQGDPAMVSALSDADGTDGDYERMRPREESAKIFRDALGLGIGLGQNLLMCWHCDYTDHDIARSHETGRTWEVCQRCERARTDRPAGTRELFQLQWRDPGTLWQNPISFRWFINCRTGLVPFVDGDGEFFMFRLVPGLEPWRHGPWIWASLAAIFSRDAQYDAQNTSSVCAPTPVLKAIKPTTPEARREAERRLGNLAFNNHFVLDGEWTYEVVSASADYIEIAEKIVNRSSDALETGLTGNVMGRSARSAFTDAGIYNRTTRERRSFYAQAWARQDREKNLVWWARETHGATARQCPVLVLDPRSPEDKLAASKALAEEGDALKKYADGAAAVGMEIDPASITERNQRQGIGLRLRPKLGGAPPTDSGAAPPQALPPAPAPAAPEPDDEPTAAEGDDARTARAAAMNEHGVKACRHNRSRECPHCGVRGLWMPGPAGWSVTWHPLTSARVAAKQVREGDGKFGGGDGSGGAEPPKGGGGGSGPPAGGTPDPGGSKKDKALQKATEAETIAGTRATYAAKRADEAAQRHEDAKKAFEAGHIDGDRLDKIETIAEKHREHADARHEEHLDAKATADFHRDMAAVAALPKQERAAAINERADKAEAEQKKAEQAEEEARRALVEAAAIYNRHGIEEMGSNDPAFVKHQSDYDHASRENERASAAVMRAAETASRWDLKRRGGS